MQAAVFGQELIGLIEPAQDERVAQMYAETVPWRRYRWLPTDALIARGVAVCEIVSPTKVRSHKLTPFACLRRTRIDDPPEQP
jgi:uncharacterized protein (DUF488 family)